MNFLAPPIFDVNNIQTCKFKMSAYLETLSINVYLVTTKELNLKNTKYLEANAHGIITLKKTINNNHISWISNCVFAFAVWNTLISLGQLISNDM